MENANAGAVYVYENTGTGWSSPVRIPPPDSGNLFGKALAMAGNLLVVSSGQATFLFTPSGNTWQFVIKFDEMGSIATTGTVRRSHVYVSVYIYRSISNLLYFSSHLFDIVKYVAVGVSNSNKVKIYKDLGGVSGWGLYSTITVRYLGFIFL